MVFIIVSARAQMPHPAIRQENTELRGVAAFFAAGLVKFGGGMIAVLRMHVVSPGHGCAQFHAIKFAELPVPGDFVGAEIMLPDAHLGRFESERQFAVEPFGLLRWLVWKFFGLQRFLLPSLS